MQDEQYEPWFRPGQTVEWVGPEPLEGDAGTVAAGDVGTVLTDDRPAASGIVVVFDGVGTFACERDEIRPARSQR